MSVTSCLETRLESCSVSQFDDPLHYRSAAPPHRPLDRIHAEVAPRVECAITPKARGLGPTMKALAAWWAEYGQRAGPIGVAGPQSKGKSMTRRHEVAD